MNQAETPPDPPQSPPPPPPVLSCPVYYYVDDSCVSQGPFDFAQLSSWWRAGQLPEQLEITMKEEEQEETKTFSASALFARGALWYYIDDFGVSQGAFDFSSMKQWAEAGFFTLETKVRTEQEEKFVKLEDHQMKRSLMGIEDSLVWFYCFSPSSVWSFSSSSPPHSPQQFSLWHAKGFFDDPAVLIKASVPDSTDFPLSPAQEFALSPRPLRDFPLVFYPPWCRPSANAAPFIFLKEINENWEFLDANGKVRGPFSTAQMRCWRRRGLLSDDLPVRKLEEAQGGEFRRSAERFCSFLVEGPETFFQTEES